MSCSIAVVSDIHYASAAERVRGNDYEFRAIHNPLLRLVVRLHRRFIWLRDPLNQNHLLDLFLNEAGDFDHVIANGDYSCNTAFVGMSDDASLESARECLAKLRQKLGQKLRLNFGDHELGKVSLFGGQGGMRLASWRRAQDQLGLQRFWRFEIGKYVLMGVVSSLIGLPVFTRDTLPAERGEWEQLRAQHLAEVRQAFAGLKPDQKVLLFCHDPSALPFLWEEEKIRGKLQQLEQTIIGHLHSKLILWQSRLLAGMPEIRFLGHTARRLSAALRQAKKWEPFKVQLCPALAGIELLKDGGYLALTLDPDARRPAECHIRPLKRAR